MYKVKHICLKCNVSLCFFNFNISLVSEYQRGLVLGFYCYQTTNLFLSYSYLMVPEWSRDGRGE